MGLFNNAITITAFLPKQNKDKTFTFTGFASRNIVYNRITSIWRNYQRTNNIATPQCKLKKLIYLTFYS